MKKKDKDIFTGYQYRRASSDIAELIKSAILSNKIKEGDRLPSERDLATQFQVGRMTIREALRTLETKGLISIKKGSSGGAFVQPASPYQIAENIADNLQLDGVTFSEVTESRIVLERSIAKYAIENATTTDLKEIEQNIEDTNNLLFDFSPEGEQEFRTKTNDFHYLLAKSAHISPLLMFHSVLAKWVLRNLVKSFSAIEEERLRSNQDHEKIFEAIIKKDLNLSQELLEKHIRGIIHGLESSATNS